MFIEPFNFSFFSVTGWGINLDYCDIEWFALERNRDHSVIFEIVSKYCISDSFLAPTSNAEEAEVERFYEDLQDLLELTPRKDVLFMIGDWNAKVGNQETPGVTGKLGLRVQNEAGQRLITVLPREPTGLSKNPLPTTQEKILHIVITRYSTLKSD